MHNVARVDQEILELASVGLGPKLNLRDSGMPVSSLCSFIRDQVETIAISRGMSAQDKQNRKENIALNKIAHHPEFIWVKLKTSKLKNEMPLYLCKWKLNIYIQYDFM